LPIAISSALAALRAASISPNVEKTRRAKIRPTTLSSRLFSAGCIRLWFCRKGIVPAQPSTLEGGTGAFRTCAPSPPKRSIQEPCGPIDTIPSRAATLIHKPGFDLVGPVSAELRKIMVFCADVESGANEPRAARELIKPSLEQRSHRINRCICLKNTG